MIRDLHFRHKKHIEDSSSFAYHNSYKQIKCTRIIIIIIISILGPICSQKPEKAKKKHCFENHRPKKTYKIAATLQTFRCNFIFIC